MSRRLIMVVLGAAIAAGAGLASGCGPSIDRLHLPPAAPDPSVDEAARRVDDVFTRAWSAAGVEPLPVADPFTVARRLSLALTGTIPSLEEIRAMEALPAEQRVAAHLAHLLADRRFADYFAERLARAFVGTQEGPFLIYRRRRFVDWLSDELTKNRPQDEVAREILTAEGLWTDRPATNFITAHARDPSRLAARTARAFLGVRMDCAECHDHPFARWKQRDFEGLAAYFAGIEQTVTGIADHGGELELGGMGEPRRVVAPRLPEVPRNAAPPAEPGSAPDLPAAASEGGRRREQLARWVTARENPYFARAAVSRTWTLLFGAGLVEPVDDIESSPKVEGALEALADDFRANGHDLARLIRVIAGTRAFRLESGGEPGKVAARQAVFAAFPTTRLRSEQIAGALVQASSLDTLDAGSPLLVRLGKLGGTRDFVERYSDAGEEELNARAGTILQRLVMMNGKLTSERVEASLFTAAGRIGVLAGDDRARVEVAYLVWLTRRPSPDEVDHFAGRLASKQGKERDDVMEDMAWALVNSTEFSWNH